MDVSTDQTKDKVNTYNVIQKLAKNISIVTQDIAESDGYHSDRYSEIDANDHVGNVDTLVDDADIENKMIKCVRLHQVKDTKVH